MHRDVKPSNILVAEDDFSYLIDFLNEQAKTAPVDGAGAEEDASGGLQDEPDNPDTAEKGASDS